VPLREHWDSLPKNDVSALQKLGAELCSFLQTLELGPRDIRPETLTYNRKTRSIGLTQNNLTDLRLLRGDVESVSFLSNGIVEEKEWEERDTVWQAGCVLLALACGKSPF